MEQVQTIQCLLALKEYEIKKAPQGKRFTFSIKFATKKGDNIFIQRAGVAGLPSNMKENRMHALLVNDNNNDVNDRVMPLPIDEIIE